MPKNGLSAACLALLCAAFPVSISAQSPPPAFGVCSACHTTEAGKTSFGPNLRGVVGRRAAILPGYAYSPALRAAGITWTKEQLDSWLTSPQKKVPGTKMPFTGYADPEKRRQVIDYLQSLK